MDETGTETPIETLETATQVERLPLHELTLIGIYQRTDEGPLALVRFPNGEIEGAVVGSEIGGRRVFAIGEADLRFEGPAGPAEVLPLIAA